MGSLKHFCGKLIRESNKEFYDEIQDFLFYQTYKKRKKMNVSEYPAQLKKDYENYRGGVLNIENPKTYSEKIQWLKLYDDNELRTRLTDKVLVREWIKEKIGEKYLIPIYGVYDSFDDIEFDKLPNQFVIKTNHSSGWNIIVKDKNNFNKKKARKKIQRWLKRDYGLWSEFEIHYSSIVPKIIVEKYMADSSGELNDYKFLCFNNECKYFWMDFDRASNHKRNVYDLNFNLQPWNQFTYGNYNGVVEKPKNLEKMIEIAQTLCQGFKHVRVDLYNIDGEIYFGEMTFTNGSGFEGIFPEEYDYKLGELIKLPID